MTDGDESRRSEALRRVAEEGHDWDVGKATTKSTRKRRLGMRVTLAVCLVALLTGGGILVSARHSSAYHAKTTTSAALTFGHGAGLGCASAPAWSPDGRLVAVLGTQQPCGVIAHSPDMTQVLYFFDGQTGHLGRILKLASFINAQFLPLDMYGGCQRNNLSLCYDHIAWSPDGQRLAVLLTTPTPDATKTAYALLVVDSHGKDAQIIKGGAYTTPARMPPAVWALWDLRAQSASYAQEPDAFNVAAQLAWGPDGSLSPSAGPPSVASAAPVGNPAGGSAAFSPWQPGNILLAGGPLLASDYWAWSPDGRYLATGLSTQIILGNTPSAATPTPGANVGYRTAAPRDEALTAILAQARAQPIHGETGYGVAWSPSGAYLAELRCAATPTQATLSIWQTATGARITSMPLALSQENADCGALALDMAWSPDGQRLALVSSTTGGVAVIAPRLN